MKPVLFGGSWSNCKLVLREDTNGRITHVAVYRQVNRVYKTKQKKNTVNISYNDFLLRLLRGELAGMTVVSSITGFHIVRLYWG
jgi:hypothetical protein